MYEQIRNEILAVIEQIQTDFSTYPLQVDAPNLSKTVLGGQSRPYLRVDIDYLPGGGQMEIGKAKQLVKQRGQVVLDVVVKGNSGTLEATKLLDFIVPYFNIKVLGVVRTHAVQAARGRELRGEWHQPLWVDFEANQFSP